MSTLQVEITRSLLKAMFSLHYFLWNLTSSIYIGFAAMDKETVKKSPLSNGKAKKTKESPKAKEGKKTSGMKEGSSGKKRKTAK